MTQQSFSELYAKYYDTIYQDKDYKAESLEIINLIHKYAPDAKTILNIGCGTGNHDFPLAKKGYSIAGVDSSEFMLRIANKKKAEQPFYNIQYSCQDIRNSIMNNRYDVALSLFHVTSYLIDDQDIIKSFQNIYHSLSEKGIFIFDFWYGPGILANLPEKRSRDFHIDNLHIKRIAEPQTISADNILDLKLTLETKNLLTGNTESSSEQHLVRFFFLDEIKQMLETVGFNPIESGSDYQLSPFKSEDRYATIIAMK